MPPSPCTYRICMTMCIHKNKRILIMWGLWKWYWTIKRLVKICEIDSGTNARGTDRPMFLWSFSAVFKILKDQRQLCRQSLDARFVGNEEKFLKLYHVRKNEAIPVTRVELAISLEIKVEKRCYRLNIKQKYKDYTLPPVFRIHIVVKCLA